MEPEPGSGLRNPFGRTRGNAQLFAGNGNMWGVAELPLHGDFKRARGRMPVRRSTYVAEDIGAALAKIDKIDPLVNAVSRLRDNPLKSAQSSGSGNAPLLHMPLLVKDNIELSGNVPTTAGSLALRHNLAKRDAALVQRLESAGAAILGTAAMSEWSNFRSHHAIPGWSATAGFTRNPHVLDRVAGSSSSGSAAAVAAGMVPGAIGTETNGSITSPASINGTVGMKPSVGLVSRRGLVPISRTQGTAGPIAKDVVTAATLLAVMAGCDSADPSTSEADIRRRALCRPLAPERIAGMRIGVLRFAMPDNTQASFEEALEVLSALGAIIIDIARMDGLDQIDELNHAVMLSELRASIDSYLSATDPATVPVRSLADVVRFNEDHAGEELALFDQGIFIEALDAPSIDDAGYLSARNRSCRMAGTDGIDRMLREDKLDLLVAPTQGPAIKLDLVNRCPHTIEGISMLAAVAGYPHLTVPMRPVRSLPVGISFVGPRWSDELVLSAGFAYEQAARLDVAPRFLTSLENDASARAALKRQNID